MNDQSGARSAALLDTLWHEWAGIGSGLEESQWRLPTRCEGWDVAALYAHVSGGVGGLGALLERRMVAEPAEHRTAAQLMRAVKPTAEVADELAARVAVSAVEEASANGPTELVARFDDATDVCARAGRHADDSVDYFGRGIATVSAAVSLRVVEAAVHLLDLQDALGRDKSVSTEAAAETSAFLLELVDPVDFLEVATGRSRESVFPVHS
jgi:uncharacterized protein (TIGR03083 family)